MGDIRGANLMIDADGSLKIIDFGLSTAANASPKPICGTEDFRAPEVVTGEYDHKVDLHSAGIALFEFLWGRSPVAFHAKLMMAKVVLKLSYANIMTRVKAKANPDPQVFFELRGNQAHTQALDLIKNLVADANERYDVNQALKHSFLSSVRGTSVLDVIDPKNAADVACLRRLVHVCPKLSTMAASRPALQAVL